MSFLIPLYRPFLMGREREYVLQCLDSTWISSRGEFINKFESEFAQFVGSDNVTSTCNGTTALHLALLAVGIGPGDEVIVPTLTYIASVNAIVHAGAKPVFVDSLRDSWNLDPEDVARKITSRSKAVMAVHLYGSPCEMEQLSSLCKQAGIFLIEDAAEGFGAYSKGTHVGTIGDVGIFSFFGNKSITTGEGGMVVAKDHKILQKAYHLKTQAVSTHREYWHDEIGYNYRMTNICAAIGLAQLEQRDKILQRKSIIANIYKNELVGMPLSTQSINFGDTSSHWLVSATCATKEVRDGLRVHLAERGVETRPFFHPAHTMPHVGTKDKHPVAEHLSGRGINLPSYPGLSNEEVRYVCRLIRDYMREVEAA